ncbi:hypothetical protein AAFF_G00037950 [Aldrovandia affinis]|uniref:Uncharacterized protein n=1 Tax=Aldrovandia affinis TaxID=143900 RepID=A0AAD7T5E4_9TELE|nr:hypothetical protein AAFF_G00037950 [Aldrovandia affinis]
MAAMFAGAKQLSKDGRCRLQLRRHESRKQRGVESVRAGARAPRRRGRHAGCRPVGLQGSDRQARRPWTQKN